MAASLPSTATSSSESLSAIQASSIRSRLHGTVGDYKDVCIASTQHSRHRGYSNWSGSTRRTTSAFGDPKYYTNQLISTDKPDVMIKVPNFDVLFEDICKVSPLARQALTDDHPVGLNGIGKGELELARV
eukprot:scaffold38927_cov57-Cyclotella_meneghiniana.AAC.1